MLSGVCRELAAFYAELPSDADLVHISSTSYFSDYYVPHERLKEDGAFHVDENCPNYTVSLNDASKKNDVCEQFGRCR
jgi:hypothetical protein